MAPPKQLRNARSLFETFHLKAAGEPVYPRHRTSEGEYQLDIKLPIMEVVGEALRVMYRSDKWEQTGEAHEYYHDHKRGGKVRFWLPCESGLGEDFAYAWPDAMVLLGSCTRWFYHPVGEDRDTVIEGAPSNSLLMASPKGYVSPLQDSRIFLAVVDGSTGEVEALIEGSTLRLTRRGIEG